MVQGQEDTHQEEETHQETYDEISMLQKEVQLMWHQPSTRDDQQGEV
jgi:hypothetical protein